jgi:hypothetical protein
VERDAERARVLLDQGLVGVGLGAAQAVVHVAEGEPQAQRARERRQGVGQRDRVDAARHGDEEPSAGQAVAAQGRPDGAKDHPTII